MPAAIVDTDGICQAIKKNGTRCGHRVAKDESVCRYHGGHLPNVRNAAAMRRAEREHHEELVRRIKADRQGRDDAVTELDKLAAEVLTFKDICRERLNDLMTVDSDIRYEGKTGEQLRAEVALYERALDRCNTVLSTNVKLGIAERKVALRRAEAEVLVTVIKTILGKLQLSREQKVIAGQVVPEELRAISAAISA